jgi:hypothetical protein
VRDSGLLHGLLELETLNDLLGHPVCGLSFEGHCIDNLIQAAGSRRHPYFYRTQVGAEIDLLLEKGGRPEIAIEVKRSMAPSPERGFSLACDDLQIEQRMGCTPAPSASLCAAARRPLACGSWLGCCFLHSQIGRWRRCRLPKLLSI